MTILKSKKHAPKNEPLISSLELSEIMGIPHEEVVKRIEEAIASGAFDTDEEAHVYTSEVQVH